ncbi:hypothetical protein [Streptomyces sp. NPDC002402]
MAGTAARAQRATTAAALAARDEAWRAFIDHTQACDTCRNTGLDCELAAELKQIWRAARKAAA